MAAISNNPNLSLSLKYGYMNPICWIMIISCYTVNGIICVIMTVVLSPHLLYWALLLPSLSSLSLSAIEALSLCGYGASDAWVP